VGVGRPETGVDAADHVLDKFKPEETNVLDQIITMARDAIITILGKGTEEGMNLFNNKRVEISS
jgi:PTH1 family peptidyl-tRNA hydrolase